MLPIFFSLFTHAAEYGQLYTLENMSSLSSRIVRAQVSTIDSYMKEGKIYSKILLDVDRTYTGIDEQQLEIHMLGGTYNDLQMQVSGLPILQTGEETLLFLNHEQILGFGQGIFQLKDTQVSRYPDTGLPKSDFSLDVLPDEREAQSCLAPIIDAHYAQGWSLKHLYTHHSSAGLNNIFPFGTYEELEYKIITCTDGKPQNAHLRIDDIDGNIVQEEQFQAKDNSLTFTAQYSGLYQLNLGIGEIKDKAISSGIAIGILYRE